MSSDALEMEKRNAALASVRLLEDGMLVGLGTGSTVKYVIEELGRKVKEGWNISCVPTSISSENLAMEKGIEIIHNPGRKIDLDIDGADEVDSKGNLIKGGGGALTREKIVAFNSRKFCVIIDSSKYHPEGLGRFKLPVEVLPFMAESTAEAIASKGARVSFRGEGKFITDNGNKVLDCDFGIIKEPEKLEKKLKMIPGVVEVGLFCSMADIIIMGNSEDSEVVFRK